MDEQVGWTGLLGKGDAQTAGIAELEPLGLNSSGPRASQLDQAGRFIREAGNDERWFETLPDEFRLGVAGAHLVFQAQSRPSGQEGRR